MGPALPPLRPSAASQRRTPLRPAWRTAAQLARRQHARSSRPASPSNQASAPPLPTGPRLSAPLSRRPRAPSLSLPARARSPGPSSPAAQWLRCNNRRYLRRDFLQGAPPQDPRGPLISPATPLFHPIHTSAARARISPPPLPCSAVAEAPRRHGYAAPPHRGPLEPRKILASTPGASQRPPSST